MINDILDVSKIEAGRAELSVEDVDFEAEVTTCVSLIREDAARRQLTLTLEMDSAIPMLRADGRRLRQVMLNLLSNAIKFTGAGGKILVSAQWLPDAGIEVAITDSGIGIPDDALETVMQPFGQVENAYTRTHEGTGLGLPMAAALVRLHGGEIKIDSQVGRGTKVSFVLPAGLAKPVVQTPSPQEPQRALVAGGRFG